MSPGATFERIYRELKRRLAEGELLPGMPIEPMQLTDDLAASITPLRDALHRLVGERLVEAPQHNGFLVPRPTEAALRDLYDWNGQLLVLAARRRTSHAHPAPAVPSPLTATRSERTTVLFLAIARSAGSAEQLRAIEGLNDRLAPYRRVEAEILDGLDPELDELGEASLEPPALLARQLTRYHRRRIAAAPAILAAASRAAR